MAILANLGQLTLDKYFALLMRKRDLIRLINRSKLFEGSLYACHK